MAKNHKKQSREKMIKIPELEYRLTLAQNEELKKQNAQYYQELKQYKSRGETNE